jgi:hypothetical protein
VGRGRTSIDTESPAQPKGRLQAAQLTSDVDALAELIDDTAQFSGPEGNLYSKRDDLRVHETGHLVLTRLKDPPGAGHRAHQCHLVPRHARGRHWWSAAGRPDALHPNLDPRPGELEDHCGGQGSTEVNLN